MLLLAHTCWAGRDRIGYRRLPCPGQKEVVTLAHKNVFRDLMFDIARHQKKTCVKDFTTLGTEKTLGSLWEREEYINMCSKEDLWKAVAAEEAKTPLEVGMQGAEHDKEEELNGDSGTSGLTVWCLTKKTRLVM